MQNISKIKTEAMDRLNYVLRITGDQMIHLIITYDSTFNFEVLKKAARMILDVEPVLGCVFVEHPKRPFWKRIDELDKSVYCTLQKTTNLERDILDYIKREYNPTRELPVQLQVFREENIRDTICIKVSHHGVDGGGILDYFNLLKKIYIELLSNKNYQHPKNYKGSRSLRQVLKQYGLFSRFRVFIRNMSPKPSWSFPWYSTKRTNGNMIIKRFQEDLFEKIKLYSKKKNVTLNDLLLTAFYRAMFKVASPRYNEEMVSVVTVNLRYMMKKKTKAEAICNLSSSIYAHVPWIENESFDATLQFVHNQMNDLKNNLPGIGSAFFIHNFFGKLKFARIKKATEKRIKNDLKSKVTHPVFTNVGLVTTDELKFHNLNAIDSHLATPIMTAPGFIFGIMTFEKKMTVSIGFYEESYSRDLIELFLKNFESQLEMLGNN